MKLSQEEVEFHPRSFADPRGRLFSYRGGLYRAVAPEFSGFYSDLLDEGILPGLVQRGLLVETNKANLELEGYGLVLWHRTLPVVSYPFEWCATMLKDAALLILDLELQLANSDLTLKDAHPWNVLFEGHSPVFVDVGAIVPASRGVHWEALNQFTVLFLNPLLLGLRGHGRLARPFYQIGDRTGVEDWYVRAILSSKSSTVFGKPFRERMKDVGRAYLPGRVLSKLRGMQAKVLEDSHLRVSKDSRIAYLKRLRNRVANMEATGWKTDWTQYYEDWDLSLSPTNQWSQKQQSVHRVLSDLKPASVLDIGSNRGWFAQLAAESGARVVATETDEGALIQLHSDLANTNLNVMPILMDFRNPTPAAGLGYKMVRPALERFRAEGVLALALVHHLVFTQHLSFEQIVDELGSYTEKWLLVEFVPREDRYVSKWWTSDFEWYTVEGFIEKALRRFRRVNTLESSPSQRSLLLFEK